jgi:hypothetical protein
MTSTDTASDQSGPSEANQSAERMSGLSDRVRRLRTNASTGGFDRWLLVSGAVLMPLGIVFILLGWAGASRTPLQFEQTDYLISGGLLGLALVIAGGFTYFAYWQTVRIREARAQSAGLARAIDRLDTLVGNGGAARGPDTPPAKPVLVATTNGTVYHRADCAAVAGRADLHEIEATTTTLSACRICSPADPT